MHRDRNGRALHTVAAKPSLARPTDAVGYQGGHCQNVPDAATCPASAANEFVDISERSVKRTGIGPPFRPRSVA